MNYFEHIQHTFTLEHVPANIRARQFLARRPFLRRYKDVPVGLKCLPAEGRFTYQRANERRTIKFNGRNLQYHALYEDYYRFGYELETALLLAILCQGSGAFFDIGANWGYFSLLAAALPKFFGPIYAFEPNPRTFADLTSTIEQAGVADRVQACHFGIGSEECEMTVTEANPFNSGLSSLSAGGAGQKVPVKPVDRLGLAPPTIMKIDAEGMELSILTGASRTMLEAKPFIVFENFLDFHGPTKTYAAMRFLEEMDFCIFLPVLEFTVNESSVLMTYGQDFAPLVELGGEPRLGAVEVSTRRRFLLGAQLNLVGVHASRVDELWKLGVADLGKC